ncbi:MAG: MFS transporter [Phycisphaerae bacterium]|nr:MFS transporter [Phycisphaerae bacterium]
MQNMPPPLRFRAASWVLYDLANTIFSAAITFLFVPNIAAASTGLINSLAMIVAGIGTPIFASLADRTGNAGRYNTIATLVCIVALSLLGVFESTPALLTTFFIATLFYQAALVFYNSLLPSVALENRLGLVSGLGVGLGYLGTVLTLVVFLPLQRVMGLQSEFFPVALAFLVFALPCMLLVRDRRPINREKITLPLVRQQWAELLETLRTLPKTPALMWFLIANFWAVDVLNTAILFYGRFLKDSFEPLAKRGELSLLGYHIFNIQDFIIIGGLAVNLPALIYGLGLGHFADRFGARKMYLISIASFSVGLIGAGIFGGWAPLWFLISICFFAGLGLAGVWTVGRKILIELVPRDLVARYFGLYGITNKVSVIGSTVCGVMLQYFGPRWAILSQVFPLLLAFFCLYMMWKSTHNSTSDEKNKASRSSP